MARRRRHQADEESDINMTPMLDIVFIMLIFFIVTTSFVKETGIDPRRPVAATAAAKPGTNRDGVARAATLRPNGESKDGTKTQDPSAAYSKTVAEAKQTIQPLVMDRLDVSAASQLPREDLSHQLRDIVTEVLDEEKLRLNSPEQTAVVELLLDDMLGLGPLEPLLADDSITDIMVNGPFQTYIERHGKLELTDVHFRNNEHVLNIARRIVSIIGRRVDETSPLVDARLQDGSRVNIIIPPLAIDGPAISIRKFAKKSITLDVMNRQNNISDAMSTVLKIAARSGLNILISGGTGSGKTTLARLVANYTDRAYVSFSAVTEGVPREIRAHPDVIEAYLGGGRHVA